MTKRRAKNAKPTGVNQSLGNALQKRAAARHTGPSKPSPYIIEDPNKVCLIAFCRIVVLFQFLGRLFQGLGIYHARK
jgi:hypothetical protein